MSQRQQQQQLVRRFVHKKLSDYYAQPANLVVGTVTAPNTSSKQLSSLLGEWHWRRVFKQMYDEREGHWLTPVELFQPHYSNIIAEFVHTAALAMMPHHHDATSKGGKQQLEIIEVGGGRGTNANLILDYLKTQKPDLYSNLTSYTLVDSSLTLHRLQKERLGNSDHADKVRFERKDLLDVAEKRTAIVSKSEIPTIVLGMEVLDNLPHDKVRAKSRKTIEQAEVRRIVTRNGGSNKEEIFVPLNDPLLSRVLKTVPAYVKMQQPTWVPTVACGVLHHFLTQRSNLSFAFADFDWLPPPDLLFLEDDEASSSSSSLSVWAEGEPIVTDMDGKDHPCYMNCPPNCDILFPTDFNKLASFVKRSTAAVAAASTRRESNKASTISSTITSVYKQHEFLETFGPQHVRSTKSWLTGHTPLIDDFSNCSVLTMLPNDNNNADKVIK